MESCVCVCTEVLKKRFCSLRILKVTFTGVRVQFCSTGTKRLYRCPFQHSYVSEALELRTQPQRRIVAMASVNIYTENKCFTLSTWSERMGSCNPAESLENPCCKALTVLTHARLRAKFGLSGVLSSNGMRKVEKVSSNGMRNLGNVSSNHCLSIIKPTFQSQHWHVLLERW